MFSSILYKHFGLKTLDVRQSNMLTSASSVSSSGYIAILTKFPPLSLKDWSLPGQFLYNKFYVSESGQKGENAKEKSLKLDLDDLLSL